MKPTPHTGNLPDRLIRAGPLTLFQMVTRSAKQYQNPQCQKPYGGKVASMIRKTERRPSKPSMPARAVSFLVLSLTLLGFVTCITRSARAEPLVASAKYVISVGGTIVANVSVSLAGNDARYSLDLDGNVAGLGNLVARGSVTLKTTGTSDQANYKGEDFHFQTLSSQGQSDILVKYQHSNVTAFIVDPPLQPRVDQVPLERAHLRRVNDMLSAFILKAPALNESVCNRTLRIFTGVERFDLDLTYVATENATSARTGYRGPVVSCRLTYKPISGHYTTSTITNYLKDSRRMLIWYAPLENSDTFIPYRVLIGTSLGDLSMVLTHLE